MKITICSGGNISHALAAWFAYKGNIVSVLTRRPNEWFKKVIAKLPDKNISGEIAIATNDPSIIIPGSDIIVISCPAFAYKPILEKIAPYTTKSQIIYGLPGMGGFDIFAKKILKNYMDICSSQRTPFICRIEEYGHSCNIYGFVYGKMKYACEMENSIQIMSKLLEVEGEKLPDYNYINFNSSNNILHTTRLYDLRDYKGVDEVYFYRDWTNTASELLIHCDNELFMIYDKLGMDKSKMETMLNHYQCKNAEELTKKISTIPSLNSITIRIYNENGINKGHRYFTENFTYGICLFSLVAKKMNVQTPNIDMAAQWGMSVLGLTYDNIEEIFLKVF